MLESAPLLRQLERSGVLAPLDLYFAELIGELVSGAAPEVVLAAALASRQTREGHVCADLPRLTAAPVTDAAGEPVVVPLPPFAALREALLASPAVGDGAVATPLVLDARGRLYLRRYWQHERRLAEVLRGRLGLADEAYDAAALRAALDRWFPRGRASGPDLQRVAAIIAIATRFTVISGGPGTGKTSTVVRLMAMLVERALGIGQPPPRMLLLAPTGKAAARLVESIRAAKRGLAGAEAVCAAITEEAATIHRALGPVAGSRTRFRHHPGNPLRADVVIVDESSMVDLAMMRRLVEAVPPRARLILLGDRDQLASVEAGAVLGDICGDEPPAYSAALRERVRTLFAEELPPTASPGAGGIGDHLVELVHSHRFGAESGIGNLARAIRNGQTEKAMLLLSTPTVDDVALVARAPTPGKNLLGGALRRSVVDGFRPYLKAKNAADALERFGGYRVLAAHRRGGSGVEALNLAIEAALFGAGLLEERAVFYPGRPVLVTQNDYQLRLFNGDIGVVWRARAERTNRVFFPDAVGSTRALAPARLPPHETVFAMSVHKSQGSELDEVAIVLPDARSPLLTRELVYTALTRARRRAVLHGTEAAVRAAIERRVLRASGLRELLWAR